MVLPSPSCQKRAVIVGAGPVGCLTAIMFASRGWKVEIYEARADLRLSVLQANTRQRSINFTISHRGIAALEAIYPDAAEHFIQNVSIPMRGRMVHRVDGRLDSQSYDRYEQCINSCNRALLNADLLGRVCKIEGIEVHFRRKVCSVDFDRRSMVVKDLDQTDQQTKVVTFDLCVGADGSYSGIRREMMKVVRMDFQQEYINHEYMELHMAPGPNNTFYFDPNHLHIWPRQSHMLIAMANRDQTFTCTLFAPSAQFNSLDTPEKFLEWFKENFPDAFQAIGEKQLLKDHLCNPRSALICTKVNPYHYKDRGILLGDAAHSMVPFYGQGLNCGLEDVRVLKILLDKEQVQSIIIDAEKEDERLARALARFSEERHKDLVAITDLAMTNYIELRYLVATPMYLLRKVLDSWLHSLSEAKPLSALSELLGRELYDVDEPKTWAWLPLYTMVTFRPDISYDQARRKALRQASILTWAGYSGVVITGLICWWIVRVVLSWAI